MYKLTKENVKKSLPTRLIGIYLIGIVTDNGIKITYVGRSKNLRKRLNNHSKRFKNHFFTFRILESEERAYIFECFYFELFSNLSNKYYPARFGNRISTLGTCDSEIYKLLAGYK